MVAPDASAAEPQGRPPSKASSHLPLSGSHAPGSSACSLSPSVLLGKALTRLVPQAAIPGEGARAAMGSRPPGSCRGARPAHAHWRSPEAAGSLRSPVRRPSGARRPTTAGPPSPATLRFAPGPWQPTDFSHRRALPPLRRPSVEKPAAYQGRLDHLRPQASAPWGAVPRPRVRYPAKNIYKYDCK